MKKMPKASTTYSAQLSSCECCPRRCGANRLQGNKGLCRTSADILISHAGLHFGEEPPISGKHGSGAIFFVGCNLHCVFCQNYQISQEFRSVYQQTLSIEELAGEMLRLQALGAHNINFVSPSHMIFQMADAILKARQMGLDIPVVYNSNGYDSVDALRRIRGLVDIYLPDIKYMDNNLGASFSDVRDYADVVPGVIAEMLHQVGALKVDDDGVAVQGLLVRHLVLPGYPDNSRRCLALLAELSPDIHLGLMSQYSPQYKACNYPGISRKLTAAEYDEILSHAIDFGLENVLIQELESQDNYLPDFDKDAPFEASNREK